MEIKKNPEYDLENYRVSFLGIGFIISLIVIYLVIEWKTYDKSISSLGSLNVEVEDEEVIITQQEPPKTPPPPPPAAPQQLTVVENDTQLEVELDMQGETFEETAVLDIAPVEEIDDTPDIPLALVEEKPVFPGCEGLKTKDEQFACMNKKIFEIIRKEFKYPDNAREMGIQGKVMVKFIINKKGKIDKIEVARGIDKDLDSEAVRIIKKMQDKVLFKPAKQGDNAVNVSYILPIVFKLQ